MELDDATKCALLFLGMILLISKEIIKLRDIENFLEN